MKGDSILPIVNRSLLIVRAKPPFIEWIKSLPDQSEKLVRSLTEKSLNDDPPCFMIPNDCDPDDALEHYLPLIKHELFSAWSNQEELWPKRLGLKEFSKWFDITWATMVHDCNSKERLDYDE